MTQTTNLKTKAGLVFLAVALSVLGDATPPPHAYPSGFSVALKLGGELCDALPQKFAEQIDTQAVALQPQDLPLIVPISKSEEHRVTRQVCLSAGLIDLVNHICHAKAIDRLQPGYFNQYVGNLSRACAGDPGAAPPSIVDARYWSDDVMNEQLGYFNQMMGMLMAINMSHHYLGHFSKYSAKMTGAGTKVEAINDFLTQAEWEVSVKAGALDALNCALSTEGLRVLFDAVDKMPARPAWAAYIAPRNTDFKKLNKDLQYYEEEFFHGRLK
jgi:hypothetical protein